MQNGYIPQLKTECNLFIRVHNSLLEDAFSLTPVYTVNMLYGRNDSLHKNKHCYNLQFPL